MEEGREQSVGASSVNDSGEESGGYSSENEADRPGNKRMKLDEKEDRISALPDSLIHHILSLLPSTKQAIQTGILSKRWKSQWSRVPVLIFDSTGMSATNFSPSIDNTLMLHDCSKIRKLHIHCDDSLEIDPQLTSKIRFATRKDVQELILRYCPIDEDGEDPYTLPEFLFDNTSLVKLELFKCYIMYDRRPNWSSLRELKLECSCVFNSAINKIVSGSPSLETLELTRVIGFENVVIASKSLKRLIFVDAEIIFEKTEISCPNLEALCIKLSGNLGVAYSQLPNQTIEIVLSGSPFLHRLELTNCHCSDQFVIASKSMKRLVLGEIYGSSDFEISCPHLEEVNLYSFVPMPSNFCSIRDFESSSLLKQLLATKILGQLQHVKLLGIGQWFIKILAALELKGLSSPLLNCKCLTLDGTNFDEFLPGIVCAIRSSPMLEKLVIKLQLDQLRRPSGPFTLNDGRLKNYKYLNETLLNSVSNLKIVKIIGLSERDGKHELVLKFVEFLLKNTRALDRISVTLADRAAGFTLEVSKKLLSFQRCFPHTTIELLCSN